MYFCDFALAFKSMSNVWAEKETFCDILFLIIYYVTNTEDNKCQAEFLVRKLTWSKGL